MKYIVLNVSDGQHIQLNVPIVFPEMLVHKDVAQAIALLLKREHSCCSVKPLSAGFVNSPDCDVTCYGESESLGVKSRPEDSHLIQMCDYGSMHIAEG